MRQFCESLTMGKNTGNVPVCMRMLDLPRSKQPSGAGENHEVTVIDPIYCTTETRSLPACIPAAMTQGVSAKERTVRMRQCEGCARRSIAK